MRSIRLNPTRVCGAIGCLLAAMLLASSPALAQRHTISGTITDAETGEVLIGANVVAVTLNTGTASNTYGFYSLTLPRRDSLTVVFSYLGFEPQVKKVYLMGNIVLDVALASRPAGLDEVTVTAERAAENVRRTQMGVVDVPVRAIERLPAILGEQDVLKVLQLLPGVQAGEEGTTGFHVRGGAADQNLVQLDEATVYNPSHLFGLFSTFNTAALNNVQLIKGGFPAYYGGRLSSTLDVSMREGNRQRHEVQGGIGLLSTQLTIEGPIKKDRASFILSGRRSYLDLVVRPFLKKSQNKNLYYFYDVNAKLNYQFSTKDRVYVSLFLGRDNADYVAPNSLGYGVRFGNSTGTLRWNHIFSPKLFANTSLILNDYFIRVNSVQGEFFSQNYSGIEDMTAKTELQYYPNPAHNIRLGALVTRHGFSSTGNEGSVPQGQGVPALATSTLPERRATEYTFYINDRWEINDWLGLNVGLRAPYFATADTSYLTLEPRVSVKVGVGATSSVKASYTVMNQFVHLIPSTTASVPTDIWALSSRRVKPQHAQQVALGYFRNFKDNAYEASLELYYKEMDNQVLFREGSQLLAYQDIENELTFGRGWSYGAELLVKRNYGRLSGWLSYTWSKTNQRFPALNAGRTFPFKYDRRHNLAVALTFDLTERWSLGGNFVYRTGSAYTLPAGRLFASQGSELYKSIYFDYERVNDHRLAAHHRLDVAATYHFRPSRLFRESNLVISLYNAYSRLNPYFVFIAIDTVTGVPETRQVTLLPIVPSVSFNFKF